MADRELLPRCCGWPALHGTFGRSVRARRIFCVGLVLVCIIGLLSPLAPAFGWLVAMRVVQAFGTSAAFPAGMAMPRASAPHGAKPPAAALGALSITTNASAALGPTIGGVLLGVAGWAAIFLLNVPLTVLGFVLAVRWLPADTSAPSHLAGASPRYATVASEVVHQVDLPGIVLFSGAITLLLAFLLSLTRSKQWLLLPVALLAAILLVSWERRATSPFIDVRALLSNFRLVSIYAQFAGLNLIFYTIFYGLPLWLEQARRCTPEQSGLLMLPFSGCGVVATLLGTKLISKSGYRSALISGSLVLTVGSLLLLLLGPTTPVPAILGVIAVIGIPAGLNALAFQSALYAVAPAGEMGEDTRLFQTSRFVGSMLSTSLLGLIFGEAVTSSGFHTIALVMVVVSILLLAVSLNPRLP